MSKRILPAITAGILSLLPLLGGLAGCATGDITIQEDMTPEQIFQKAQEALDNNQYDEAIQYYSYLLEEHPDDERRVVAAKYELAFINYKQGNLKEARTGFREVLSYYSDPKEAQMLPEWPKVLAQDFMSKLKSEETKTTEDQEITEDSDSGSNSNSESD